MKQQVDAKGIRDLLKRQLRDWPLLRDNYQMLDKVQTKRLSVAGVEINVQFTPSRMISSAAKIDPASIRERKCFLCPANLPPEQESLPFGEEYLILCNPYPIFPEHFTVPTLKHIDQSILDRFQDMLELSKALKEFTVFYNGPRSGASAPDHTHFQVLTRYVMPIDRLDVSQSDFLHRTKTAGLYLLTGYLRSGFVILSESKEEAESLFRQVCRCLEIPAGETEPRMNIFCNYQDNRWMIKVIPRRKHRPSHFFAEGADKILTGPGAADIGGTFVASRFEDFRKLTPEVLQSIYEEVCFSRLPEITF